MYEYIKGSLALLAPTYAVIDVQGIGYNVMISLQTYSYLTGRTEAKLYIHQIVREDANLLYGFFDEQERHIFRLLINVNGVGPSIALMMLSSLSADEVRMAILQENLSILKGVKGIGLKTAQRILVDLKDQVSSTGVSEQFLGAAGSNLRAEALSALVALGFAKTPAEKAIDKLLQQSNSYTVEDLIKAALKQM
ncbi:MAG: Holliday junction branch migration protein RuvA [Prevotellaceae bacterium]|jgi:Holliday junction DNA helicase RuvA|nr:Holliday junction branch migration protein RuvA [Prevotellaceae bacterium]